MEGLQCVYLVVILASLINQCLLNIVPVVIRIVNLSLSTGTVSNGLKQVVVTLFLKNKQTIKQRVLM